MMTPQEIVAQIIHATKGDTARLVEAQAAFDAWLLTWGSADLIAQVTNLIEDHRKHDDTSINHKLVDTIRIDTLEKLLELMMCKIEPGYTDQTIAKVFHLNNERP